MLPLLGLAQMNSKVEMPMGENTTSEKQALEIKRNAQYNLDEIKVRWKKAALENCTGVPCTPFTCGTSTISDLDGNSYNTVLIGTQCWTKQNLKVTKYNDGSAIPLDASGGPLGNAVGETWSTQIAGAYTIYGNEPSTGPNATNSGFLYNGYAATDARNICPSGWHVPTDGEWTKLIQFIDPSASASAVGAQSDTAGAKLKSSSTSWLAGGAGTDDYGFTGLPGSQRQEGGGFAGTGLTALFWSSTPDGITGNSFFRFLSAFNISVSRFARGKMVGFHFRCLKD
jgi:uncharacterized protein (TIGR02145 family)